MRQPQKLRNIRPLAEAAVVRVATLRGTGNERR
jgi:hypothetical protein